MTYDKSLEKYYHQDVYQLKKPKNFDSAQLQMLRQSINKKTGLLIIGLVIKPRTSLLNLTTFETSMTKTKFNISRYRHFNKEKLGFVRQNLL